MISEIIMPVLPKLMSVFRLVMLRCRFISVLFVEFCSIVVGGTVVGIVVNIVVGVVDGTPTGLNPLLPACCTVSDVEAVYALYRTLPGFENVNVYVPGAFCVLHSIVPFVVVPYSCPFT